LAGTVLISGNLSPVDFTSIDNDTVVFVEGSKLWRSDGTAAGTKIVNDIASVGSLSYNITSLGNGKAVFRAHDDVHGTELWITDGTEAGTKLVHQT
jgi:ELWxxDGT repeat protein